MAVSGGDGNGPNTLPREIKAEIRKEAVQQVAKYAIAGVAALIAVAGAGWVLYLKDKIPDWVDGVPSGAVMAFDLSDNCPDGWRRFDDASGRFIIGSGQGDDLPKRTFRVIGGREVHRLANEELPPLQIIYSKPAFNGDKFSVGGGKADAVGMSNTPIDFGGTSKPIDLLPPYIPLRYCRKN